MSKTLKLKAQYREITFTREMVDGEARTINLSFSSELPVERWFGNEILDHSANSVRMQRLDDGAPLLLNHNPSDHVGVVEKASIDSDRKGRAVVRFGKSARANEVFQDVLDGIRTKVSVGYQIYQATLESSDNGKETYRVNDWEPFEISLVSIPADDSVGVGRGAETEARIIDINHPTQPKKDTPMDKPTLPAAADNPDTLANIRSNELKRITAIESTGKTFEHIGGATLAREFIGNGKSVDEFNAELIKRMDKKPVPSAEIGMTDKEVQRFSFVRALYAIANPHDKAAQAAAAFEREASAAAAKVLGKNAQGIMVPFDVMKRDLTVGTATAGGHTVSTDLMASDFISLLRNNMALDKAGVTILGGLNGNVAIPRQTAGATAYWVTEGNAPTESQQAVDQATLTPKTVGAFTDYSRRLLLQSSLDVEMFIRNDLARVLGLAIDLAGVNGSGSGGQPTGILNTAGIGSVAGGTNGAVVSWANIIDLESAVATVNADIGNLAYLTNAKQRGKMKQTPKVSGFPSFIWDNNDTPINGYKAITSNQVPSNLTKGSASGICSAIIFGNFADALFGLWGGLDMTIDPYTSSTTGTVRIVALQDVDFTVRHAESFAAMKDAL